jgi:hypothetical protein
LDETLMPRRWAGRDDDRPPRDPLPNVFSSLRRRGVPCAVAGCGLLVVYPVLGYAVLGRVREGSLGLSTRRPVELPDAIDAMRRESAPPRPRAESGPSPRPPRLPDIGGPRWVVAPYAGVLTGLELATLALRRELPSRGLAPRAGTESPRWLLVGVAWYCVCIGMACCDWRSPIPGVGLRRGVRATGSAS